MRILAIVAGIALSAAGQTPTKDGADVAIEDPRAALVGHWVIDIDRVHTDIRNGLITEDSAEYFIAQYQNDVVYEVVSETKVAFVGHGRVAVDVAWVVHGPHELSATYPHQGGEPGRIKVTLAGDDHATVTLSEGGRERSLPAVRLLPRVEPPKEDSIPAQFLGEWPLDPDLMTGSLWWALIPESAQWRALQRLQDPNNGWRSFSLSARRVDELSRARVVSAHEGSILIEVSDENGEPLYLMIARRSGETLWTQVGWIRRAYKRAD